MNILPKSNCNKFLLLWSGELISAVGSGVTSFGLGVYVFNQTNSAAGMALVVSLTAASDTIINGSEKQAEENKVEDGEFSVFVPFTQKQEEKLLQTGITMEKMFSIDFKNAQGATLRVMKNRSKINLIAIKEGRIAKKNGEVLLEQRYCEENKIRPGDTVELAGETLTVTGTGSVPDYDTPIANMNDSAAESKTFGLAFVTEEQYARFLEKTDRNPENLCYAYRLNGKLTDEALKKKIRDIKFDYNTYDDPFFKEMIADTVGKRDDLLKGLNELNDGTQELKKGMKLSILVEIIFLVKILCLRDL